MSGLLGIKDKEMLDILSCRRHFSLWMQSMCTPWEKVVSYGTRITIRPEQQLFGTGERIKGIYYLQSGIVRLESYSPEGNRAILLYVPEKNLFGDAAYFNQMPVYAIYTAVIDSVAYFFPSSLLEDVIFPKYPDLNRNLTSFLAYKVGVLLHHLCDLQSTDVRGKVCRLLCDLAQYGNNRSEIYPHITQQEMAIALGLHRATFNRIISELRALGVLGKVTKKRIEILDLERLVQLAEGTYAL